MFENITPELKNELIECMDYHFPKWKEGIFDHKTRSFADGNRNRRLRHAYFLLTGNDRSPEKGQCNCLSTYIGIGKDIYHIQKNYLKDNETN